MIRFLSGTYNSFRGHFNETVRAGYKCRTNSCKCNKSAIQLHELFSQELSRYSVKEALVPAIVYELSSYFHEVSKGTIEQKSAYKIQLLEVNKKLETIEEKYYVLNEMNKETFDKFHKRYQEEKYNIAKQLDECSLGISTPKNKKGDKTSI